LGAGDHRPDLAGGGEQLGRLAADHREIFVLGRLGVLGDRELQHLAFGDHGGGRRQNVERAQRADLDHHLEGLAEQEVADQHARLVAPEHAGGELAAAHVALVDDVVMQQRRGVHEFDGGRELDVAVAPVAAEIGHRERQHRPQPLAARGDQVVGDLRDHRHVGAGARQDHRVDALHVGARQRDQRLDAGLIRFPFLEGDDDTHWKHSGSDPRAGRRLCHATTVAWDASPCKPARRRTFA
jgi:hypothetical protein